MRHHTGLKVSTYDTQLQGLFSQSSSERERLACQRPGAAGAIRGLLLCAHTREAKQKTHFLVFSQFTISHPYGVLLTLSHTD